MGFIPGMKGSIQIWKPINMIYNFNKMKNKDIIIISMDAENPFEKIRHSFVRTPNKVDIK